MFARSLRVYSYYFAQFLKAKLAYKWDFFSGIIASLFAALSGVIYIYLLIDGKVVTDLKGWSRNEVLFIYGYSLIATGIFGFLSPNLFRFGDRYVIQGQFDRVLLRPLNSFLQVVFESFNLENVGNVILGIILVVLTAQSAAIGLSLFDMAWLMISAVCGAAILLSVFTVLSSMSFHFEDRLGLVPPMYNLVVFSRYPLPIFNRLVQFILSWLIPFAFVSYYPATHFFRDREVEALTYLSPLVAVICLAVAMFFWQLGVSKYASTGN